MPISVAFLLNRRTAFDANRARDAAAQHQVVVRGVYDRVNVRFRQVALPQEQSCRANFYSSSCYYRANCVDAEDNPAAAIARADCCGARRARGMRSVVASIVRPARSRSISKPRRPRPTRVLAPTRLLRAINELIFDSLVKNDRNGQFVGRLAESIEHPSPTEIVYHLNHGVRFSDGRELTARDVLFTYNSITRARIDVAETRQPRGVEIDRSARRLHCRHDRRASVCARPRDGD